LAKARNEIGLRKRGRNRLDACRTRTIALAEGAKVNVIEVQDAPGIEHKGGGTQASQNVGRSKALIESIQMPHAVQQGQDHGIWSDCRGKRCHGAFKVVGFATEQDEVEGVVEIPGKDRWWVGDLHVPEAALNFQTGAGQFSGAFGTDKKRDVLLCLQQPTAKVTANAPGTNHKNAHIQAPGKK
jgi:hypothetical protein